MSELEEVPLGREPADDLLVVRTADTRLGWAIGIWVGWGRRGCGCMVSSSRSTSASVLRFALIPWSYKSCGQVEAWLRARYDVLYRVSASLRVAWSPGSADPVGEPSWSQRMVSCYEVARAVG